MNAGLFRFNLACPADAAPVEVKTLRIIPRLIDELMLDSGFGLRGKQGTEIRILVILNRKSPFFTLIVVQFQGR